MFHNTPWCSLKFWTTISELSQAPVSQQSQSQSHSGMKMNFYSHANETYYHKKVRVFTPRKWRYLVITVVPKKWKDFAYELRGEGRGEGVKVGWGGYKVYQDGANVSKSTESSLAVTTYSDLYKTFHPSFQISFRYCVCQLDGNRENCDVRLKW